MWFTSGTFLVCACVVLAALVFALWTGAARRVRRKGGGAVGPGLLVSVLVLALGLFLVDQFKRREALAAEAEAAERARMSAQADLGTLREQHRVALASAAPAATLPVLGGAEDQQVVDRFARLLYATRGTWQNRTWLGIRTLQNPNDVWVTQEIIHEVKPDLIIEAGTAAGGSALIWAMIQREVNPDGRVITMDIAEPVPDAVNHPIWKERVEFILGSSTDPATVSRLAERVRDKRVLVILDSDHSMPHVLQELRSYAPMVGVGSYLVVQDTNVNGHPVYPEHGPGPMEALDEFLKSDDRFEVDRTREAFLFTMHPRGYLKRVR